MQQTVLITGCSTGIGRATARSFLADDWTVYATARSPDSLSDLAAAGATTLRLDVTEQADVDRVVETVLEQSGRLDCLVNNAGYGQLGAVEDVPTDAVREQYEVNVFGPHRLVRAVAPHMRRRGAGTIVTVSSFETWFPFAGTGVYSASKAALTTESRALRQELAGDGVDVVVVEPSLVATEFYDRMREELADLEQSSAYADLYSVLDRVSDIDGTGPGVASPDAVADAVHSAAVSEDPEYRHLVGPLATIGQVVGGLVPAPQRTRLMALGIRLLTSAPGRRALDWWVSQTGAESRSPQRTESRAPAEVERRS